MTEPHRTFHFIFGLREQTEPFHLLHYLCLASCIAVNRPHAVHFHYRHEPFGPWWDRIKPNLQLRPLQTAVAGFAPERYGDSDEGRLIEQLGLQYAHESDFIRLDVLLVEGGVYADMDTVFVRPYPTAWYAEEFGIGEENSPHTPGKILQPSLCNAVLFAKPQARFAAAWRQSMSGAFDGSWNNHSCAEAARIWRSLPNGVRVLPSSYFYRYGASAAGFVELFDEAALEEPDVYSIHLWAHLWWDAARTDFSTVHAGEIDEHWIRTRDCTLAHVARRYL